MTVVARKKQRRAEKLLGLMREFFRVGGATSVIIGLAMLTLDVLIMLPIFTSVVGIPVGLAAAMLVWGAVAKFGPERDALRWRTYALHPVIWRRFQYALVFCAMGTATLALALAVIALDPAIAANERRRDLARVQSGITMMGGTQVRLTGTLAAIGGVAYLLQRFNKM